MRAWLTLPSQMYQKYEAMGNKNMSHVSWTSAIHEKENPAVLAVLTWRCALCSLLADNDMDCGFPYKHNYEAICNTFVSAYYAIKIDLRSWRSKTCFKTCWPHVGSLLKALEASDGISSFIHEALSKRQTRKSSRISSTRFLDSLDGVKFLSLCRRRRISICKTK